LRRRKDTFALSGFSIAVDFLPRFRRVWTNRFRRIQTTRLRYLNVVATNVWITRLATVKICVDQSSAKVWKKVGTRSQDRGLSYKM